MSLIRGLSNPECLYIINSGRVYSFWSNQHNTSEDTTIPARAFNAFMKKLVKDGDFYQNFEHCGVKIEELETSKDSFKWALTYRDKHIVTMFQVTWIYIITQNDWT